MNAVSPNTSLSYKAGLEAFSSFLRLHNLLDSWPPPLSNVTQFIAYLSITGKKPNTVKTYLAGISYQCKMLNQYDITSHFLICKMIEGMRRLKPSSDNRLPITIELLRNMVKVLPSICSSLYETNLFQAAFCLAFFGFLRVGEFTVVNSSYCRVFTSNQISIDEIDNNIELTIPYSKTDQYGKGKTIVIPGTGCSVCPVLHIKTFKASRPKHQGPFFCHFGGKPLTRFQFTAILSKVLKYLGVDTTLYKSHSFRIGAASLYYEQGKSEEEIKVMGRWKSQAFQSYIRIPKI